MKETEDKKNSFWSALILPPRTIFINVHHCILSRRDPDACRTHACLSQPVWHQVTGDWPNPRAGGWSGALSSQPGLSGKHQEGLASEWPPEGVAVMGAEWHEPHCAQDGRSRPCLIKEACGKLMLTQPIFWLMGASHRSQLSLDAWLSNCSSSSCWPSSSLWTWSLSCGSWFRQTGFPKVWSPEPHIMACISISYFFMFLWIESGLQLRSGPTHLWTQPQPPSIAPLLSLQGPEMGLHSSRPGYTASCSSRPEVPEFAALYSDLWTNPALLCSLAPKFSQVCILSHALISSACAHPCCSSWWPHHAVQLLNLCHEWALSWVGSVAPRSPGRPESSLVLALLQGWPQDSSPQPSSVRGKWADLSDFQRVGGETFSRPNPPRIAVKRNSNLDPFFWSHLVGFNSGCNFPVTFKTTGFSYQSVFC